MYAEPGKGAIHGAKDLRHGDVYLRLGLIGILGDFEDSDVEVHSVQEGHIDISTFEGQVIVGTRGAADAKVRKDASVRGIRTFRQKFLAGHACGVQPFGFTTEEALDSDGKKYRKRVIVEEQAEIVRRIFRMYAEGYGHRAICRDLNIEGVLFPKPHIRKDGMVTTGWAPSTVKTILKRESYIAIFHYNKTESGAMRKDKKIRRRPKDELLTIELPELRIVPQEVWDRVVERHKEMKSRALRYSNGRLGGRPPKHEAQNLLSGMMLCAFCKGGIVCETPSTGRQKLYVCGTRKKKGNLCENNIRMATSVLNEAVLQAIEEHALTPEAIERVIALSERDDVKEKEVALFQEQGHNARKQKNLMNAIAGGTEGPTILVGEIERLEARQKAIAAELAEMRPIPKVPRPEVESRLEEWRRLLRGSVTQGRLVLQKILKGRLVMLPLNARIDEVKQKIVFTGYQFSAPTRFDKLFQGLAIPPPKFIQDMAQSNLGYEHLTAEDIQGDTEKEALLEKPPSSVSSREWEPAARARRTS